MILDEELVVISKIKKHVKDAYQSIAQTMMSGGVDNMETYKYIIGQINALESVRQEISNLQQDKELNENTGTIIDIKSKNNNSK